MEEETAAVATEDVLDAVMEYLVDPFLPTKVSPNDPLPDISLQQSTAKQMHAVVLLYNYYHRLQYPQLEFLDFESFCKVALSVKPSLSVYLEKMRDCNSDGQVKDLSITEKAIMDACNISLGLCMMKDAQSMEGWPVSKVAVFLTNSMMQNCLLKFSASTEGVWSLIERNEDASHNNAVGLLGSKKNNEKEKDNETHFQQLAMSAVKEATGICSAELTVLESHVTYSLSKEKTVARFFIMKCGSVEENKFVVTMKDAIDSLQGPLVKKSGNSYFVSDPVEFFHLLPYSRMIRDCFSSLASREDFPFRRKSVSNGNGLAHFREGKINRNSYQGGDEAATIASTKRRGRSSVTCQTSDLPTCKANNIESLDQREDFDHLVNGGDYSKNAKVASRRRACDNVVDRADQKGETKEIQFGSSTTKNNLVEQRKRQRVCLQDGSSEADAGIGNGEFFGSSHIVTNDITKLLGRSAVNNEVTVHTDLPLNSLPCSVNSEGNGACIGLQGRPIVHGTCNSQNVIVMEDVASKKNGSQSQLIPHSMPEDIIWVGSVCFPRKYKELYERIVEKFGDIIIPESKQVTSCSELVSATMKSFFEIVDSIVHASPDTVDTEVIESWDFKLKFCELSGLKVGWLRDHLERVRQAYNPHDNAVVRELETRAGALSESLQAKRKQAADLANMLEQVRVEEKALLEEKIVVDTNLKAARVKQKCFSLSLV